MAGEFSLARQPQEVGYMPKIFAIDPGPTHSAWVDYDNGKILAFAKEKNEVLRDFLTETPGPLLAIEMIASFGMPVGAEVFETCVWIGRFLQASIMDEATYIYRKEVKITLCGTTKAKDANIRQAIIDRYGGKDQAIGKKKDPGPLYEMSGDMWSALAIAITLREKLKPRG